MPNVVEVKRLCEQVGVGGDAVPSGEHAREVSKRLDGVEVLEKARKDVVAIGTTGEAVSLEESKIEVAQGDEKVPGEGGSKGSDRGGC